jgi:integrase
VSTVNKMMEMAESYIGRKHALGFKIVKEGEAIRKFAAFTDSIAYDGPLDFGTVKRWIDSFDNPSDRYRARLYDTIRTFSTYVAFVDEGSARLPKGQVSFGRRIEPYIYSEQEIMAVMREMANTYSPDGLRALSLEAMVGLMWCTGMRPSEIVNLHDEDFDRKSSVMTIRGSKFGKSRLVPLSTSAASHLEAYLRRRDTLTKAPTTMLFVTTGGKVFDIRAFDYAWMKARHVLLLEGETHWKRRAPRLYDIRHSACTWTLARWHREGRDINALIPCLSTYVGHKKVADTYWYLTGAPVLMETVSGRFEQHVERSGS